MWKMKTRRQKMTTNKKEPLCGHTETQNKEDVQVNIKDYYITILMAVTTIIAGWHIVDVWSGVVTMLCGCCAVMSFAKALNEEVDE